MEFRSASQSHHRISGARRPRVAGGCSWKARARLFPPRGCRMPLLSVPRGTGWFRDQPGRREMLVRSGNKVNREKPSVKSWKNVRGTCQTQDHAFDAFRKLNHRSPARENRGEGHVNSYEPELTIRETANPENSQHVVAELQQLSFKI